MTTVSKASAAFDPANYWRGPVWINVNWFLIRGLEQSGLDAEAELAPATDDRPRRRSGFVEYYEPTTGEPLGTPRASPGARH